VIFKNILQDFPNAGILKNKKSRTFQEACEPCSKYKILGLFKAFQGAKFAFSSNKIMVKKHILNVVLQNLDCYVTLRCTVLTHQ